MAFDKKKLGISALTGVIWKFSERVGAQLVTLIVQIILARLLSPEDYSVVGIISITRNRKQNSNHSDCESEIPVSFGDDTSAEEVPSGNR